MPPKLPRSRYGHAAKAHQHRLTTTKNLAHSRNVYRQGVVDMIFVACMWFGTLAALFAFLYR